MNRRELLVLLGGLSTAVLWNQPLARAAQELENKAFANDLLKRGFVIGDGRKEKGVDKVYASVRVDLPGNIFLGNFAGTEFKKFETTFLTHQIIQNPVNKDQLIAIQKWGKNALDIKVRSASVTPLVLPKNTVFFGHGVFTPDAKHFLVSAMDYDSGHGCLLVYESSSLKCVDRISTYGMNPHELQLSHDGKNYMVMNSGVPKYQVDRYAKSKVTLQTNFTKIDVASGKLVSQVELLHGSKGYAHFFNIDDKNILALGLSLDDPNSVQTPSALALIEGEKVTDLMVDSAIKDCIGEALSARVMPGGKEALVTFPESDKVAVIDIEKKKVTKTLSMTLPRAVIQTPEPTLLLLSQSASGLPFLAYSSKTKDFVDLKKVFDNPKKELHNWAGRGPHGTEINWPFIA